MRSEKSTGEAIQLLCEKTGGDLTTNRYDPAKIKVSQNRLTFVSRFETFLTRRPDCHTVEDVTVIDGD